VEPLGAELRPRRNCSERASPDCGRGLGAGDPGCAQSPDGDPVDLPADRNTRVDRGAGSVCSANQDAPDRTRAASSLSLGDLPRYPTSPQRRRESRPRPRYPHTGV
jgi:hypothetical protein